MKTKKIKKLEQFVSNWNKSRKPKDPAFYLVTRSDENGSRHKVVTGVEVRFPAMSYRSIGMLEDFNELKDAIRLSSRGLICLHSSSEEFNRGILNLSVASSDPNFAQSSIIKTIKALGEGYFVGRFIREPK